jgi:osmoprotectant transport system permease protein
MAGLRVATVSTVALVTIGAIVSYGGLGNLLLQAVGNQFKAQIFAASLLGVVLAVVLDLVLVLVQRILTPWTRHAGDVVDYLTDGANWSGPRASARSSCSSCC